MPCGVGSVWRRRWDSNPRGVLPPTRFRVLHRNKHVQEVSSDIVSHTYMLEAFRYLVTCGLNQGGKPAVMTAMAKYYATETMRKIVNHGMGGGLTLCGILLAQIIQKPIQWKKSTQQSLDSL